MQASFKNLSVRLSGVAVVSDRFDRAPFHGFFALGFFFGSGRLLVNVGITAVVIAREIVRRRFTAKVAIDALIIDVELARNVIGISVRNISHKID